MKIKHACLGALTLYACYASGVEYHQLPAAQKTTVDQVNFSWSSAGPVNGQHCVQISEAAEPVAHTWHDNYFCSSTNLDMKWSSAGIIDGFNCTQIMESADPHTWADNYLCLPIGSAFQFSWTSASIYGQHYVQWLEASDPDTWSDNYLTISKKQDYRFDERYYLQPHNSYEHGSHLTDWLDKGYRSLEIDVIDRGNWEHETNGPYVTHDGSPGGENCNSNGHGRLGDCLKDVYQWIEQNNPSEPILIFVDMKNSWDPASAWKSDEVAMLNDKIVEMVPAQYLYKYSDLITKLKSDSQVSNLSNPRAALKVHGWPLISSMQKKMIVALTGGYVGDVNDRMEWVASTRGDNLAVFLCPDVDTSDPEEISGQVDSMNLTNSHRILCSNVKAGDHYTATANRSYEYKQIMHLWDHAGDFHNTDYAALYIAIAHGVNGIGIDVSAPSSQPSWIPNPINYTGVRRGYPGFFRIRSTINSNLCLSDNDTAYNNGSPLVLRNCAESDAQKFVYSAEGQLRLKGNDKYCVDFDTGSADNGDRLHLWDCDGGRSEKWAITSEGMFKNRDKDYTYCMDIPHSNASDGQQLHVWQCHGQANQKFILEPVETWYHNPDD